MPPKATATRGYGTDHQRLRRHWQKSIDRGGVHCWRCGTPIPAGSKRWDLGHDDNDRSRYHGPECIRCNRSAGARKGNTLRARRRRAAAPAVTTTLRW